MFSTTCSSSTSGLNHKATAQGELVSAGGESCHDMFSDLIVKQNTTKLPPEQRDAALETTRRKKLLEAERKKLLAQFEEKPELMHQSLHNSDRNPSRKLK